MNDYDSVMDDFIENICAKHLGAKVLVNNNEKFLP